MDKLERNCVEKERKMMGGNTGSGMTTFTIEILRKMAEHSPTEATRTAPCGMPNRIILEKVRYGEVAAKLIRSYVESKEFRKGIL